MKKFLIAASILVVSLSSFAAFTNGMTEPQVKAEVIAAVQRGDSLAVIAKNASAACVDTNFIVEALISSGKDAGAVTTALVAAGGCFNANSVIAAAVRAGANYNAMVVAAAAGGADVTQITPPTANGPGGGFNQSRASTFGGGGRSSVSGS